MSSSFLELHNISEMASEKKERFLQLDGFAITKNHDGNFSFTNQKTGKSIPLKAVYISKSGEAIQQSSDMWNEYEVIQNKKGGYDLLNKYSGKKVAKNAYQMDFYANMLQIQWTSKSGYENYLVRDNKIIPVCPIGEDEYLFMDMVTYAKYLVVDGIIYDVVTTHNYEQKVFIIKRDGKLGVVSTFMVRNKDCEHMEDDRPVKTLKDFFTVPEEYHIISTDSPAPYFKIPIVVLPPIYDKIELNNTYGPVTTKKEGRRSITEEWVIVEGQVAMLRDKAESVYRNDGKNPMTYGENGFYFDIDGNIVLM